jgi:hypothetical protein
MKVELEVISPQGIFSRILNPLFIVILGVVVVGGAYFIVKVRRKK